MNVFIFIVCSSRCLKIHLKLTGVPSFKTNLSFYFYQLIFSFISDVENFPTHLVWGGSMYLVSKTFLCLREMFCSARQIQVSFSVPFPLLWFHSPIFINLLNLQDWFTDCARTICSTSNKCVEWETPLGLPVIQPYVKTKSITKDGNRAIYQS